MNAPCKDCEKRSPGCHGRCEVYQAYSAERAVIHRKRKTTAIIGGYTRDATHRMHNNHRVSTHNFAKGGRKDGNK